MAHHYWYLIIFCVSYIQSPSVWKSLKSFAPSYTMYKCLLCVPLSSGSKNTRSQWGQTRSNWRSLHASRPSRSSSESSGQARSELLLRLPHGYGESHCPVVSIHRLLKQQCVLQGPVCSPSDTCKTLPFTSRTKFSVPFRFIDQKHVCVSLHCNVCHTVHSVYCKKIKSNMSS